LAIRYLDFRSYVDSIDTPVQSTKDRGYYFKVNSNDGRLIKNTLEDNGFVETGQNNFCIFWSSAVIKQGIYLNLKPYQKVNHFPRSVEITRKDLLYKNLAKMQAVYKNSFNFFPMSYLLPNESTFLQEAFDKTKDEMLFIVKPVASSQGRGIYVTNSLQDVK
jgi:tubulin polyglutamylase TTLL5